MKRQSYIWLGIAVIVVGWAIALQSQLGVAADTAPARGDSQLQVISYSSGLTGFFEPSSKKFYLYASDLKTPFMTVQVEKLGDPLKVIKAPPQ